MPSATSNDRLRPPADAVYRQHYLWGWQYSQRESATLDYVDAKYSPNKPGYDAAMDGYLDYAASREKWHLAHCERHDNTPQGCGQS